MSELKPCPFCGGDAVLDGRSDDVRVRCEVGCQAEGPTFYFHSEDYDAIEKAESDARDAWNRRAALAARDDARDAEIARLREALKRLRTVIGSNTSTLRWITTHYVKEGDVYPLIITRVWGDSEKSAFNGQLMLDGNDLFWVTSTALGDKNRECFWPPREVEEPSAAKAA